MPDAAVYPARPGERDRFVLQRRGAREPLDPWRHQGVIVEDERSPQGNADRIATVFLTGRECPWRCAMCDLWRYTTPTDTPAGAIPAQIARARAEVAGERITAMKLYNAGSFFDPRAVPEDDYPAIAASLSGVRRVIVESHPSLVGDRVDRLQQQLARARATRAPTLEVAMGLETAHPEALARLNKRFTLADFERAAAALTAREVQVRVFLLIAPPFVPEDEQDAWLLHSLDAAFECGAAVVSLVPTRDGNGTVEALAAAGLFRVPTLDVIERSFARALAHARGRGLVFLDLWDLDRFAAGGKCAPARRAALAAMNRAQAIA
jgi:radical SAM enzyme (TIGR01210 family)